MYSDLTSKSFDIDTPILDDDLAERSLSCELPADYPDCTVDVDAIERVKGLIERAVIIDSPLANAEQDENQTYEEWLSMLQSATLKESHFNGYVGIVANATSVTPRGPNLKHLLLIRAPEDEDIDELADTILCFVCRSLPKLEALQTYEAFFSNVDGTGMVLARDLANMEQVKFAIYIDDLCEDQS